jgi:hypothetical protein
MLDDVGTKVPRDRLGGFELSWLIETSPGIIRVVLFQCPITDGAAVAAI